MSQLKYDSLAVHERKVLLMQVLGFSPLRISQLRSGEILLSDALTERINEVIYDPNNFTQCAIVCQNMKRDGASYESLDPTPYLEHINELKAQGGSFADDANNNQNLNSAQASNAQEYSPFGFNSFGPTDSASTSASGQTGYNSAGSDYPGNTFENRNPFDQGAQGSRQAYNSQGINRTPFRNPAMTGPAESTYARPAARYFIRSLDISICLMVVGMIFRLLFKTDPINNANISLAYIIAIYVAMFAIEPIFIHLFATTPGKFLIGIKITDLNDNKLSWKDAYLRSFRLLRFGFGFMIPIYSFIKLIACCVTCKSGLVLPWDVGVKISRPEKTKPSRIVLFILAIFIISGLDLTVNMLCELPPHRGEITEDEFYENCAYIVKYDSVSFSDIPEYEVQTQNGKVVSVTLNIENTSDEYIYDYYNQMYVAFLAFAGAQDGVNIIALNYGGVLNNLKNSFIDFDFEYNGLTVTNDAEYTGYARNIMYGYLYQTADSEEHIYRQTFIISK